MEHIEKHLERLLNTREFPKTICPSEVARALTRSELEDLEADSWREMMPMIREHVFKLRDEGLVEILQKGNVLPVGRSLEQTRGPIRVRKCV